VYAAPPLIVIELFGGVISSMMVSGQDVEVFPAPSLYHTYTVFVPSPVVNVHAFVVAKVSHAVHELVLLMHIWDTLPELSDADNVKVTARVFAYAAPPLIVIEPVGGVVSDAGVVALDGKLCALWLPALSTADTVYE